MSEKRDFPTTNIESEPSAEELQRKKSGIEEKVRDAGLTVEGSWRSGWTEVGDEKTGKIWPNFIRDREGSKLGAEISICMKGGSENSPEVHIDKLRIFSPQEISISQWMDKVYGMLKEVRES